MSSMQGQGQRGAAWTETVHSIDAGYLPPEVAGAFTDALQANGFGVRDYVPGRMPPGTLLQFSYDDGSIYGQQGWHLNVLVQQQRQEIAASATGGGKSRT